MFFSEKSNTGVPTRPTLSHPQPGRREKNPGWRASLQRLSARLAKGGHATAHGYGAAARGAWDSLWGPGPLLRCFCVFFFGGGGILYLFIFFGGGGQNGFQQPLLCVCFCCLAKMGSPKETPNVNPGETNPWLIHGGDVPIWWLIPNHLCRGSQKFVPNMTLLLSSCTPCFCSGSSKHAGLFLVVPNSTCLGTWVVCCL